MWCHSLLACTVSVEKSADNLMGVPLYVICHFFLAAFNILYLSLIFVSLITMCLSVFPLWVYPAWDSLHFLDLVDYFFSHIREVFSYYLFKYFPRCLLSLSSPSGTPIKWMLMCLMLSQRSLRLSSFLFILSCIFCSEAVGFPPIYPLGHLSILLPLLFYLLILVY